MPANPQKKPVDLVEIADAICSTLHAIYSEHSQKFRSLAKSRAIQVEQLAAAAITEMLSEKLESCGVWVEHQARDN